MKKTLVPGIIAIAVLLITLFTAGIVIKTKSNKHIKQTKANLPGFRFYNMDSSVYVNNTFNNRLSKCIIYFDPECEHCLYETTLITKNISAFKATSIFMISTNSTKKMLEFAAKLHLKNYKQIKLLWDKNYEFYTWFGHAPIPSLYIYNKDNRLVKEYHGETKIDAVTDYLQ